MKQVLLRVPDDVHARLAASAAAAGQSVNALATSILDAHVDDAAAGGRDRLRSRARQLGLLVEAPPVPPTDAARRRRAVAGLGVGAAVLDDLLAEGR